MEPARTCNDRFLQMAPNSKLRWWIERETKRDTHTHRKKA